MSEHIVDYHYHQIGKQDEPVITGNPVPRGTVRRDAEMVDGSMLDLTECLDDPLHNSVFYANQRVKTRDRGSEESTVMLDSTRIGLMLADRGDEPLKTEVVSRQGRGKNINTVSYDSMTEHSDEDIQRKLVALFNRDVNPYVDPEPFKYEELQKTVQEQQSE